jgi:hypothetical protein
MKAPSAAVNGSISRFICIDASPLLLNRCVVAGEIAVKIAMGQVDPGDTIN